MAEKNKRLAPKKDTLRALFARSGNQCAFPGCNHELIDEDDNFVGQVCHIEGAAPGGERFNATMTNEDRRMEENLVLFCYKHHIQTDNVEKYTSDALREIKKRHEEATTKFEVKDITVNAIFNIELAKVNSQLHGISSDIASLTEQNSAQFASLHSMVSTLLHNNVSSNTDHQNSEITMINMLIKENQYSAALKIIEETKRNRFSTLQSIDKRKILHLEGIILSDLGKKDEAATVFLTALPLTENSDLAWAFAAIAHHYKGNLSESESALKKAMDINPLCTTAYNIYIEIHQHDPIASLKTLIPDELKNVPEINFNLGISARKQGNFQEAIRLMQIAYDNATERKADFSGALGSTIVESVVNDRFIILTGQVGSDIKDKVKYGIQLITEAWDSYQGTMLETGNSWLLLNLKVAKNIIGDSEGALENIRQAHRVSPDDLLVTRHLVVQLMEMENYEEALTKVEKLIESDDQEYKSDGILLKADVLITLDRFGEALQALESMKVVSDMERAYHRLVVKAYVGIGSETKALQYIESLEREDKLIKRSINSAALYLYVNDLANARHQLAEASAMVDPSVDNEDLYMLAELCYNVSMFDEATNALERVTDTSLYSNASRRLIQASIRAQKLEQALILCQRFEDENGIDSFLADSLQRIYQSVNNIQSAVDCIERYLRINPDDQALLLRLATLHDRQRDAVKLSAVLKRIKYVDFTLSHKVLFELARMYYQTGNREKALDIAYKARRQNYTNGEAHSCYVGFFMENKPEIPTIDSIIEGATVILSSGNNDKKIMYTLLSDDVVYSERNEIKTTDSVSKILLGRKVGEEVVLGQSLMGEIKYVITKIESKFLSAFTETFDLLQTRFVTEKNIQIISLPKEGMDSNTNDPLVAFLDKVGHDQEYVDNLYKSESATIGIVASLRGWNIVHTFKYLCANPHLGVYSFWTFNELSKSLKPLKDGQAVVFDIITLLTYLMADALWILERIPNEKYMPQSAIDEINNYLREQKLASHGQKLVSRSNGQFTSFEISGEQMQQRIATYESLLTWIKSNCAIKSVDALFKLNRKEIEEQKKILGVPLMNAALIAKDTNAVLLSDDGLGRRVAHDIFGVNGINSFLLAFYLKHKQLITDLELNAIMLELHRLNFHNVPAFPELLTSAVLETNFKLRNPLIQAINGLRSPFLQDNFACGICAKFISELMLPNQSSESFSQENDERLFIVEAVLKVVLKRNIQRQYLTDLIKLYMYRTTADQEKVLVILENLMK